MLQASSSAGKENGAYVYGMSVQATDNPLWITKLLPSAVSTAPKTLRIEGVSVHQLFAYQQFQFLRLHALRKDETVQGTNQTNNS